MNSEAKIIIAFLFNRSGKSKLSFSELYLTLSMNLNWFTPDDAKEFVQIAIKEKLLLKKDDLVIPGFDHNKITVPVGFTPTKHVFEKKEVEKDDEEPVDILSKIVTQINEKTKLSKDEILKKIREIEKEKNITTEVAALMVGKDFDVSLEGLYEDVENKIF